MSRVTVLASQFLSLRLRLAYFAPRFLHVVPGELLLWWVIVRAGGARPSMPMGGLSAARLCPVAPLTGDPARHLALWVGSLARFLSENAEFARMVEEHGFAFIGPTPEHIEQMGDKVRAKQTVKALGLPVVPGSEGGVEKPEEGLKIAQDMGFPVIIKAASGGGGKGMQVVRSDDEFSEAFTTARREAAANSCPLPERRYPSP